MYLIRGLINALLGRTKSPKSAPVAATMSNRVHVFHGTFASELEATDYCLTPMGRNKNEPLARDLPDAMIDTSEVEILFGQNRIYAAAPMLQPNGAGLMLREIGPNNTMILVAEAAFGGLPYTLNDTPKLHYLGAFEVT